MHLYHKYIYSNVNYFFGDPDVDTNIVYYDGEFSSLEQMKVHIAQTCYAFSDTDPVDIHINTEPSDPEVKIRDNVFDYKGHFSLGDKYIVCLFVIYETGPSSSVHSQDRTRMMSKDMRHSLKGHCYRAMYSEYSLYGLVPEECGIDECV